MRTFIFFIVFLSYFSATASFDCPVKLYSILVYKDGMVNINHTGRNDYTVLCNVLTEYKGVQPSVCVVWTATLQALKNKGLGAYFQYSGSGSCATLPTYGEAPVPWYVGSAGP